MQSPGELPSSPDGISLPKHENAALPDPFARKTHIILHAKM
jgi:hypothetical protein